MYHALWLLRVKTWCYWCSIVAGLGQLRSGAGMWRGSSSSSRSSEPAAASSDDGGSSTEAARTQLANLLHRRAANDLQVLLSPPISLKIFHSTHLQSLKGQPRATYTHC